MEIFNKTDFTFALMPGKLNYPSHSLSFIVKGTFSILPSQPAVPANEQLSTTGDEFSNDDEDTVGSLNYETDFVYFKPSADLLLKGKCHTPDGKYIGATAVTFQVGSKIKSMAVFGDRYWKRNTLGIGTMSAPEPFKEMELQYENSFGGPGFKANPVGNGYGKEETAEGKKIRKLPNVEDPNKLIDSPGSKPDPAGFGPLNRMWHLRQSKLGTYKGDYLEKRWPWFPEDFDYSYFNAAPPDMQVEGYLRGDEKLYFENLHPDHAQYHSQLPGLRLRCFITKKTDLQKEDFTFIEVPLRLDTLWIDMEAEKLVLIWRGWTEVLSEEYEELQHTFIMSEQLKDKPESKDQCYALFLNGLEEYESEWAEAPEEEELPKTVEEGESEKPEKPEIKSPPDKSAATEMTKTELIQHIETQSAAIFAQLGISLENLPPELQKQAKEHQQKMIDKITAENPAKMMALEQEENEAKMRDELAKIDIDYDNLPPLSDKAKSEQQRFLEEIGIHGEELSKNEEMSKFQQVTVAVLSQAGFDPENLDALIEMSRPQLEKIKEQLGLEKPEEKGEEERQKEKGKRKKEQDEEGESIGDDYSSDETVDSETDGEVKEIDINQRLAEGESLEGVDLSGHDFSGQELAGVDFSGAILAGAIFSGVNLEGAVLANADLKKVDLSGANLSGANLANSDLSEANLEKANLEGADLTESILDGANLKNCLLNDAIFEKAKLTVASLDQVVAIGAMFSEADLTGSSVQESDLNSADLSKCLLHNTNFKGANLSEASLEGAQGTNISCIEANLTKLRASEKCDFSGGKFNKCTCEESIWHGANLTNTDFTYCKMAGADFSKCNLEKANLSGSDIKTGRFTRANLKSAKMIMSNLFESSLEKADLTNTDLSKSNMYAAEFLDVIINGTKFNGTNLKMTKLAGGISDKAAK